MLKNGLLSSSHVLSSCSAVVLSMSLQIVDEPLQWSTDWLEYWDQYLQARTMCFILFTEPS